MPIYEYRCSVCGEKFEKFVRLSQPANELECPACGSQKVSKAFSVFGTSGTGTRSDNAASRSSCGPVGG